MSLLGIHYLTAVCSDVRRTVDFYFGVGEGEPGTIMTYFGYPAGTMRSGRIGTGMTHHVVFVVENDEAQHHWRQRLMEAGVPVSSIMDRTYFKSIYFSDPDGHILEIATLGPWFLVDEGRESLGKALKLPRWLESERKEIEQSLSPLT